MADHNIQINIDLNGAEKAKASLESVRSVVDSFNNKEISFKVATAQFDRAIQDVKRELDNLQRQKKDLEFQLNFKGDASKKIPELEAQLKSLKEEYQKVLNTTGDLSELAKLSQAIKATEQQLADANSIKELDDQIQSLIAARNELTNQKTEFRIDTNLNDVNADIDTTRSKVEQLIGVLETASAVTGGLSSGFSLLGDFAGGIASSFEGMSNLFKFDAIGTASRYLTAMATRTVTGQVSGIIQRYDIMNTFEDYMALAGVSNAKANASLNAVDLSIRGIPIGLDEAAFRLRKYQMYLNDIDRATNFTIGIQKAITAGGASEQMKNTAYTQIDRLLATGKLGQSRQWLSLFNGLGVSLRFLREELALDPTADLKQIASDLADGTIATEDFIDAIARLADNEGLDKALEIYKGTIEAWQSNINNAVKRGGQKIMESVNSVMEETYGTGITGVMKLVRDQIDAVALDASTYIRDNPQNATIIGNAVSGIVERALSLDVGGLSTKTIERAGALFDAIFGVFDSLPPGALEDFTSFAITWAGPMATVMKAAQSGLPAMLGVFDRFKDFDMGMLMKDIVTWGGRFADVIAKILGVFSDKTLSNLISFGLVWGRPLATVLGAVSGALRDMAGALGSGVKFSETNGIFGGLTWLVTNHPVIMGVLAAITAAGIAIHNIRKEYKENLESALEESGHTAMIEEINQLAESSETLRRNFEDSTASYKKEVDGIRKSATEASELLDTVLETNRKINESIENGSNYDDLYSQQIENIEKLKTLVPELSGLLGLDTEGRLENVAALEAQGDAYINLVKKQAEAEAMRSQLERAFESKWEAESNIRNFEREQSDLVQSYKDALATVDELQTNKGMEWLTPGERRRLDIAKQTIEDYPDALAKIWTGIGDSAKTREIAEEQIEGLAEGIGELGRETQQVEQNGAVDQVTEALEQAGVQAEETGNQLDALSERYQELKESAEESIKSQINLFKELNTESEQSLSQIETNVGENAGRIRRRNSALENIESAIFGNGTVGEVLTKENKQMLARYAVDLVEAGENTAIIELGEGITAEGLEGYQWIIDHIPEIREYNEIMGSDAGGGTLANIQLVAESGVETANAFLNINENDPSSTLENTGGVAEEAASGVQEYADAEGEAATNAQQAATNSNSMKSSIMFAGASAIIQSVSMMTFAGSLNAVQASANTAFHAVSNLANAIGRLQDKEITIKVNILGGLGHLAKGGMAGYYASGGNVLEGFPGMASGTDTIPAWLTPGEYVIRRSAVGMFGSRLMDRINKMDIGGAFDALMTRISNPMMHGNTYNRDNHATVNNYFYGDNGQNYSQRKAYRYVGSL